MRLLVLLLAAGCGVAAGDSPDAGAGPADGAAPVDAGEAPDAGLGADAGTADGGAPPGPALWCNTQWPSETRTARGRPTEPLYAQVWVDGVTPGADARLQVEVGLGPQGAGPNGADWRFVAAERNAACAACGNNDEYRAALTPELTGTLLWAARVRYADGPWLYCDRSDGGRQGSDDGWQAANAPRVLVSEPGPMRIVSLNLRCLIDDWEARRPVILEALLAAAPDLVGLQEGCAGAGRDNVAELAAALGTRTGASWRVARTSTHTSWDLYQEGLAVLTPHRLLEAGEAPLPDGIFPRKVLLTRVVTPQGPVTFATTHLDHRSAQVRAGQAAAVVEAVTAFSAEGEAALVVGDMNETPGGAMYETYRDAGWIDLWTALRPSEPGPTFPASAPSSRIDYLWLSSGASGLAPAQVERILSEPAGGVYGSDHLGLLGVVSP